MQKYLDTKNNRLVFTGKSAGPDFWDKAWDVENFKKVIEGGKNNRLVIGTTKKFLPAKSSPKILEAGCGNGQFVLAFHNLGYDAYGVDYADKTIAKTKSIFPELKISVQDVRKLEFPNDYFDAYWSVGVIEHFFNGYQEILEEIKRVVKPGGYAFISFPHMSLLRKLKVKLGLYPPFDEKILDKENFYQFALDHDKIIENIANSGFILEKKIPNDGTKGLKDEISFLKPPLQKIYSSRNFFLRVLNYSLSLLLAKFSSHAVLLVFRKK